MNYNSKLTEDQTIKILIEHLKKEGWFIEGFCLGQKRGVDVVAIKDGRRLYVEAKGAKASDNSPTKKNEFFNSTQIKTHFGVAIIKSIKTQNQFPNDLIAIAQPDDLYLKKVLDGVVPKLKKLNIIHYWVNPDRTVLESY
ncbi:MAG: hypothetical protein WBG90_04735 [Saonia sp.]